MDGLPSSGNAVGGRSVPDVLLSAFLTPGVAQAGEKREGRPMAVERDVLRDWHRLFGLLLTDFFTGSPFTVEVERDLSQQQQFLDVLLVRRGRGRFAGHLPDGLD